MIQVHVIWTWIIFQNSCKELDPIDKIITFLYLTRIQSNFTISSIPKNYKLFNMANGSKSKIFHLNRKINNYR